MRALVQRVSEASVTVDGKVVAHTGVGLLVFLGVETEDTTADIAWLAPKIANLRIFNDDKGVMNRSLQDVQGGLIVVSQFTLHAQTKKGNRPSYIRAARPDQAVPLYEAFVKQMETLLKRRVGTGIFGADMKVSLLNDGPVTIWIDTKRKE